MKNELKPSPNGRDTRGRFAPGNGGGPGNPHARSVARFKAALVEAVSEEDIREVAAVLITNAKAGERWAVRELLDRLIGRPLPEPSQTGERESKPVVFEVRMPEPRARV